MKQLWNQFSLCLSQVFQDSCLTPRRSGLAVKPCKRSGFHWILYPSMKSLKSDRYPEKDSDASIKFLWAGIRKDVPLTCIDCTNRIWSFNKVGSPGFAVNELNAPSTQGTVAISSKPNPSYNVEWEVEDLFFFFPFKIRGIKQCLGMKAL